MEHVQIHHLGFYLLLSFYDTFNLYHVTKRNIIYAYFEKKKFKSLFNWTIPVKYTGGQSAKCYLENFE